MERELATLDETTLNSSSADDLKKLLLKGQESTETKEPDEKPEESTEKKPGDEAPKIDDENANAEEKLQVTHEPEPEPEPVKPKDNNQNEEVNFLKQQNQDLISLLKNHTNTKVPVSEEKKLSLEQKLEGFTSEPDDYIDRRVDEKLKPQLEKLKALEEKQVFQIARNASNDFKRLEPLIKKLMAKDPDYISSKVEPMKRLEGYYLLAEGLEAKYLREKSIERETAKKAEQAKAKKSASSLPGPTRKTEQKVEKSVDQMSSKEIANLISNYKA